MKFVIKLMIILNFVNYSFSQDTIRQGIGSNFNLSYPGCFTFYWDTQSSAGYYIIDTVCPGVLQEDTLVINGITNLRSMDIKYFKNLKHLDISGSSLEIGYVKPLELPKNLISIRFFEFNHPLIMSLPDSIEKLRITYASGSGVKGFNSMPNNLREFSYSNYGGNTNFVQDIFSNTPDSLQRFSFYNFNTSVDTIYFLPSFENAINLNYFWVDATANTNPYSFVKFPKFNVNSTIDEIRLYGCSFDSIFKNNLPLNLRKLTINSPTTAFIDAFPENLQYLDLNIAVNCIPPIPETIIYFNNYGDYACTPNYTSSGAVSNGPMCSELGANPYNCSPVLNTLFGTVFHDSNSDCLYNDILKLKEIPIILFDSQDNFIKKIYTNNEGYYAFSVPDGIYKIKIDTSETTFRNSCINYEYDYTFTMNSLNPNQSQNFQLNCGTFNFIDSFDIKVNNIIVSDVVRPGNEIEIQINSSDILYNGQLNCISGIQNYLDSILIVRVKLTGPISYIDTNSSITYSQVGDTILLSYIDSVMNYDNYRYLNFRLQVDSTAQANDVICIKSIISTPIGDLNLLNNTLTNCFQVVNSYDPNMKETFPFQVLPGFDEPIRYTVHFQNTGNAPAINVMLIDTLDFKLALETFKVINSSHDFSTTLDGNRLIFKFLNINLADSLSNPEGSKGYVEYEIKPKNAMVLDEKIFNTAYIYFDFNEPIVTNTSVNWCTYQAMSVDEVSENKNQFIVYPNPVGVGQKITISNLTKEKAKVELLNVHGIKVSEFELSEEKNQIDLKDVKSGIYILRVSTDCIVSSKKIVVL